MGIIVIIDVALKYMRQNSRALWYMATQLSAKSMAALAQLYAIYVFTKIHAPADAAIIFILLGYGIWIQVFEFGLSQVIQNGLNGKTIRLADAYKIIVFQYALMVAFAALVLMFPGTLASFQGVQRTYEAQADVLAFPVGVALMFVATSNVLVQRMLLVVNRGMVASKLIFLQAISSIVVLFLFQWRGANVIESVTIYLSIPILIYSPLMLKFAKKIWRIPKELSINWRWILRNGFSFWGLTALSSIYMGADYFYVANYLTNAEVIKYHFSSRIFFISYIAYFSFVQYRAKSIRPVKREEDPQQIWGLMKGSVLIGILSVFLVLVATLLMEHSGGFELIGVPGLVVVPLMMSAALYFCARVLRDVGLVVIWNLGLQRFLYALHLVEVVFILLLLKVLAPKFGGIGVFIAMAIVAALSSVMIYIALYRTQCSRDKI